VGASKELMKKYGIGLGGKFIFPNDFGTQRYIDATFSATGLFSKWLQVALVVDNLAQAAVNRGFYREVVLGTKINVDSILLIYLDPHWTPGLSSSNAWGYEAGIEFPFFTDLFLRLGQFTNSMVPYQAAYGTGFGVGGGWLAPKLSIDYSFTRTNAPVPSYAHNFGATIYF